MFRQAQEAEGDAKLCLPLPGRNWDHPGGENREHPSDIRLWCFVLWCGC